MRKIPFLLILALSFTAPSIAWAGNGGVFDGGSSSSGAAVEEKRYIGGSGEVRGFSGPGQFVDRHAWRSGFAGTLVMWRRLIENALPSDKPFPSESKKSPSPKK